MTNKQYIQGMSTVELAKTLAEFDGTPFVCALEEAECEERSSNDECWICYYEWLRKECTLMSACPACGEPMHWVRYGNGEWVGLECTRVGCAVASHRCRDEVESRAKLLEEWNVSCSLTTAPTNEGKE